MSHQVKNYGYPNHQVSLMMVISMWWSIYLGGGMFPWHNFNYCKFIMPWPRYRMNSSRLLNRFKCMSQVIRALDAHIKGEPVLCLGSLRLTFFSSDLCSLSVRMSFSWVCYINPIQIGKVILHIHLDCNFTS